MVARKSTVKAKVEMDPTYKVPRRFYDVDEPASKGDPREIAEAFLKKAADDLQINPDLSNLRFDQVKESVLGTHALFQQQHGGRPVTGAWVRVDVDQAGKIFNVQSDLIPESVLSKAKAPATLAGSGITDEQAIAKALAATGSTSETPHTIHGTEQVAYPVDGQPAPAWKVVVIGDQRWVSGRSTSMPPAVRYLASSAC
jgi:Zn-dependent metalloprotease